MSKRKIVDGISYRKCDRCKEWIIADSPARKYCHECKIIIRRASALKYYHKHKKVVLNDTNKARTVK